MPSFRHSLYLLLFSLAMPAVAVETQPDDIATALAEMAAVSYAVDYEARYRGFRARGQGTFEALDDNLYRMRIEVALRLFGQTLTSIDEQSDFRLDEQTLLSQRYQFDQSGLGSRFRQQTFDHAAGEVLVLRDEEETTVSIPDDMLLDELNAIFYLRSRLALGDTDISFTVLDGRRVETHRYQVTGTTVIENDLANFDALQVERIRASDSPRSTTLWFAPQHAFLLVKLEQTDAKDRTMELTITAAEMNGEPL